MTENYSIHAEIELPFEAALAEVNEQLALEGFGIISNLEMDKKFKEKLGVTMGRYTILGACNPKLAYQALQAESDLGVMLPCNVVVYEKGNKTVVASINPLVAMAAAKNEKLRPIAEEVSARLHRVIQNLS